MASNGGRYGPTWERLRARVIRESEPVCGLCGGPIDMALPDRDPITGRQNPWAKTIDHITPLAFGGRMLDRANLQLAHRRCQQVQGGQTTKELWRTGRITSKTNSRNKRRRRTRRRTSQRRVNAAPPADHGHSREW